MNDQIIKALVTYIKDTLSVSLIIDPWTNSRNLPFFLKEQYAFYRTEIATIPCILVVDKNDQDTSPALVRKHIDLLRSKTGGREIVYIRKQLSSFNRKRLVEQKVCFIVPGNQMYLPFCGLDFREHFKRAQSKPEALSPSAQVVIIGELLKKSRQDILQIADLANQYGYSVMTMSRVFRELESLGLADVATEGRKRQMILKGTNREIWEKSLMFLRSPIIQRLYLDQSVKIPGGILAGFSALSRYSSLAESPNSIWAVKAATGRSLMLKHRTDQMSVHDLHCHEIEVWSYDPKLFANEGMVDRLSLFLSLRNEKDERVETAIEQMMKDVKW